MICIKKARSQGELAPGRHTLVLEWSIQPSGKVANPKLKGPANVLGTSLPGCFSRGMRKWKFPSTEISTRVTAKSSLRTSFFR